MFDNKGSNKSKNDVHGQLFMEINLPNDTPPKEVKEKKRIKEVPIRQISSSDEEPKKQQYNNLQYLQEQFQMSKQKLKKAEKDAINEKMHSVELLTYERESCQNNTNFLQAIQQSAGIDNKYMKLSIQETIEQVSNKVVKDIDKKYKVHKRGPKSKDDLAQLERVDRYRLLKIKNGEIKNKVGNLRDQLERQYFENKNERRMPDYEIVKSSDYYHLQNPKTIQASEFVSNIQQKRKAQRRRYQDYLQMKKQEEMYKMELMKEQKIKQKEERRRYLELEHQRKHQIRKKHLEQQQKKKADVNQWSKIFQKEKPLYIRREEQFIENQLIPDLEDRREKLLQKKLQNRPINMEEINDHDERYMDFKKDDQIRKQAYLEMIREQNQLNENQLEKLYKGQYRLNVLQEMHQKMIEQDPKDIERVKKARQIVYGDQIKQKILKKAKQLETLDTQRNNRKQFKKRTRNINGSFTINQQENEQKKKDPRTQGKEYLHFVHNLVKEKGIKKSNPKIRLVEEKGTFPNYLHELHKKRESMSYDQRQRRDDEVRYSLSTSNDVQSLKAKAQSYDKRLRRYQVLKKHNDVKQEQDIQMEKEQLSAIRAKMRLLNRID